MAHEHQNGAVPQPALANLDRYMEAGIDHDHEQQELLGFGHYHALYKAKLAQLHSARPIPPDARLWTADDVARAEAQGAAQSKTGPIKLALHETQAPVPQRKTGTR
jgi:hypothetical protein